jgi:hypothetical protein
LHLLYLAVVSSSAWVLLSYRLPREPSTPRIALWRRLRALGVAQLGDGLVALPADNRTREQLEWLAGEVEEAGGEASVWLAEPSSAKQARALAEQMQLAVAAEYLELAEAARAALKTDVGSRKRRLAKLRRDLRRIRRRDYFPPPEREEARAAVEAVASSLAEVAA